MVITDAGPGDLGDLWILPGVYAPQADTYLLARALCNERIGAGTDVLDIGTGSGALALYAARTGARVAATDVSWRAVVTTRINAARGGHRIRVRRGHLLRPWRDRDFDVIVSNPPYVPAPRPRPGPPRGAARAWDAGPAGRTAVDELCLRAPALLRRGGVLLMVHSGLCGVEPTLRRLADAGLRCSVTERVRVPFGPVLTEHLPWLRAQGLLGADEEDEELVVVRGERS